MTACWKCYIWRWWTSPRSGRENDVIGALSTRSWKCFSLIGYRIKAWFFSLFLLYWKSREQKRSPQLPCFTPVWTLHKIRSRPLITAITISFYFKQKIIYFASRISPHLSSTERFPISCGLKVTTRYVAEVTLLHSQKVPSPIPVTSSGITTSVTPSSVYFISFPFSIWNPAYLYFITPFVT